MVEQFKTFCPACAHLMAKPKRGLSTIEFRRIVHKCVNREDLYENIFNLIKIYRNITKDAISTVIFCQDFESWLDDDLQNVDNIKLWLFGQLNMLEKDVGEKAVYRLLYDSWKDTGINEPFAVFYDIYAERIDNPLSKNCVSRALSALGLKTKMVRLRVDEKEKSVISIQASAEELQDIFRKNGISY
jgi:hypothetical protein